MSFDLDKFEYDMSVLFPTDIILEFISEVMKKFKKPPKIDGFVFSVHGGGI